MHICLFQWFPDLLYNLESHFHIGTTCYTAHITSSRILPRISYFLYFSSSVTVPTKGRHCNPFIYFIIMPLLQLPAFLTFKNLLPFCLSAYLTIYPSPTSQWPFHSSCTCFYLIQIYQDPIILIIMLLIQQLPTSAFTNTASSASSLLLHNFCPDFPTECLAIFRYFNNL